MEVVEAFKKDELYVPKDYSGLSCQELFVELEEIFSLRKSKELKYEATVEKIRHLFNCNDQLLFVQKVRSYGFCEVDEMMLVLFSHLFVNNNDDSIRFYNIEFLNDSRCLKSLWKMQFNEGTHILIRKKLIEFKAYKRPKRRFSFHWDRLRRDLQKKKGCTPILMVEYSPKCQLESLLIAMKCLFSL